MPPDTVFASPRANTIIASVAMKGWMRKRETRPPETAPALAPSSSVTGTDHHAGHDQWSVASENGHRAERQDAPHREIDAAGDDDQRHAAGEDAVDRRLAQRVAVHRRLPERAVGVEDRADQEHQHQREHGASGGCGRAGAPAASRGPPGRGRLATATLMSLRTLRPSPPRAPGRASPRRARAAR